MTEAIDDLSGLGFFYASADMARDPRDSAARCADARASWAAVLCESVDGRRQSTARVVDVARELRSEYRDVIAYTFPGPQFCRTFEALDATIWRAINQCRSAGIEHLCLDFEPFAGADWNERQIARAVTRVRDAGLRCSITIYSRSKWLKIQWPAGVPIILQVYERARDLGLLRAAMRQKFQGSGPVVPAIGTYSEDDGAPGAGAARLENDLDNVRKLGLARDIAIWCLATTDRAERRILRGAF